MPNEERRLGKERVEEGERERERERERESSHLLGGLRLVGDVPSSSIPLTGIESALGHARFSGSKAGQTCVCVCVCVCICAYTCSEHGLVHV